MACGELSGYRIQSTLHHLLHVPMMSFYKGKYPCPSLLKRRSIASFFCTCTRLCMSTKTDFPGAPVIRKHFSVHYCQQRQQLPLSSSIRLQIPPSFSTLIIDLIIIIPDFPRTATVTRNTYDDVPIFIGQTHTGCILSTRTWRKFQSPPQMQYITAKAFAVEVETLES